MPAAARRIESLRASRVTVPLDAVDPGLDVGKKTLHVLNLAEGPNVDFIIELAALLGVRTLAILADQQETGDEYRFNRQNDSQKPERIGVEHRRERYESRIHRNPEQEPECVNYDEIRVSDERRHPLGDSLVNTRFTGDLLFSIWKFPERLVASRVGAENGIGRVFSSALRADYQMLAPMLSLLTIASPLSLSRYDIKHADVRHCKRDHDHSAFERYRQKVRRIRSVGRDEIDPLIKRKAEPGSERSRGNIE